AAVMSGAMRWMDMIGVRPTFPTRKRLCAIGAPDAKHMTYRGAASMNVGLFNTLQLSATQTVPALVAELNRFQPHAPHAYPSAAAMLAEEQIEGRLRISPRIVCTSSELRTEDMTDRIRSAWGVEPFNCMGLTETGIAAVDCPAHEGLHVFEDQCIL